MHSIHLDASVNLHPYVTYRRVFETCECAYDVCSYGFLTHSLTLFFMFPAVLMYVFLDQMTARESEREGKHTVNTRIYHVLIHIVLCLTFFFFLYCILFRYTKNWLITFEAKRSTQITNQLTHSGWRNEGDTGVNGFWTRTILGTIHFIHVQHLNKWFLFGFRLWTDESVTFSLVWMWRGTFHSCFSVFIFVIYFCSFILHLFVFVFVCCH